MRICAPTAKLKRGNIPGPLKRPLGPSLVSYFSTLPPPKDTQKYVLAIPLLSFLPYSRVSCSSTIDILDKIIFHCGGLSYVCCYELNHVPFRKDISKS